MTASAEARARAREIFTHSGNVAVDSAIAKQLAREGHGSFTPQCVGTWRRRHRWAETSPRAKQMTQLGEELRQVIQVRTSDDLDQVEMTLAAMTAAGRQMAAACQKMAEHIIGQIGALKLASIEEVQIAAQCLETVSKGTTDFVKSEFVVGKSLQDLRLLRVSSAFGANVPRDGEIIPPDRRREREPADPLSAQEAVLSNFAH